MSVSADNPMIAIASTNRSFSKRKGRSTLSEITLFERCSGGLADLRFDSDILETFYRQCSFPQVRRRSTFLDLGRSARMHQELKKEQLVRSEMIKSLMPDQVAEEVMQDIGSGEAKTDPKKFTYLEDSEDEDQTEVPIAIPATDMKSPGIEESVGAPERAVEFRKFHVNQIEDVSILFADIVGFTKMSSNKSASHLVELLSDLFGRFDRLCELTGCEKIATLGDCYYCVAGCPNPVPDHAERACEMGRSMCLAIQQFDEDHKEEVNMRVGVHTGKVICGIVGTRRFKFDVWSNDVTLANEMESSGEAGKVHISETTLSFVDKIYEYEQGPDVEDIRQLKVLVEFFNKEDQCYAIKHTKNEAVVKTFFLNDRLDKRPVVELPRQTLHTNSNTVTMDQNNSVVTPLISAQEEASSADAPEKERKISATLVGSGAPPIELRGRGSDPSLLEALRLSTSENQVFAFPPISPYSLRFKSDLLEQAYRRLGTRRPRSSQKITWATPRMTLLVNMSAHAVISLLVILACVVAYPMNSLSVPLFVVIGLTVLINLIVLVIVGMDAHTWIGKKSVRNNVNTLYTKMFTWYRRNLFGALLILLPSLLVLSGFRFDTFNSDFWPSVVQGTSYSNQTQESEVRFRAIKFGFNL
ncbi:Adenylate cyclase type 9 [Cichlidogyrus casuarinus]|uniref:adenylate cyclase n=1 Tax=Cichlidogyrus casuarinus TaxID=1844966 RepID=A0ABD2PTK8_9PLAT